MAEGGKDITVDVTVGFRFVDTAIGLAWLNTAEMLHKQWTKEIKAHEQTKRELTARIVELQAALAMQAGE